MNIYEIISVLLSLLCLAAAVMLVCKVMRMIKRLEESQRNLQIRQMKVDTYPYKRDIYLSVVKITTFARTIMENSLQIDPAEANIKDLAKVYLTANETMLGNDALGIIERLFEAKFLFPEEVYMIIRDMTGEFDLICSCITQIDIFTKLDKTVKEAEFFMNEKKKAIDGACRSIIGSTARIKMLIQEDMDIQNIAM
jgi:hypothetical protein